MAVKHTKSSSPLVALKRLSVTGAIYASYFGRPHCAS
jgi:hypothetical protein